MNERRELNKLVIATLSSNEDLKAVQLYDLLRISHYQLLRKERVKSFKSFVRVLNFTPSVISKGNGVKQYSIQKNQ